MKFLKRFVVYFSYAVCALVVLGILVVGIVYLYVFNRLLGHATILIVALIAVIAFIFAAIHHFEVNLKVDIRDKKQREKLFYEWCNKKRLISIMIQGGGGQEWANINPTKSVVRKFTQLNPGEKLVCDGCLKQKRCSIFLRKPCIAGVGYDPKDFRKKLWVDCGVTLRFVTTCDDSCFANLS